MLALFSKSSRETQANRPQAPTSAPPSVDAAEALLAESAQSRAYLDLKVKLHQELIDLINLPVLEHMQPAEIQRDFGELVRQLLAKEHVPLNQTEQRQLVIDILDEVLGLGPLEPLLKDPTVSDILVNTHSTVFVERRGLLERTNVRFKDDKHLLRIITKIVGQVGRRIDESQPMVDARLPDGSRVNAAVPPAAVDGPLLSIRKFAKIPYTIESLIQINTITVEIAELLKAIVKARLSALISGGTGSGKTTFLNAMSRNIDDRERVVTIEDAAELQLQQSHIARLECRPPNIEGQGQITQRQLVINALRMRPDRIIVGEVRGGEAFDMLQAMNTGHEGSMTTIHANTPRDAISRLEQMIGMAGIEIPARSMRAQIASALPVVIQLERMSDGRRRLVSLQEITGMESDMVSMQEIFRFNRRGIDADGHVVGEFRATGVRPKFMGQIEIRGMHLHADLFRPDRVLG